MKNKKKNFFWGIGITFIILFVVYGVISYKQDDIILYSDVQGVVEGEAETIIFSVDFADRFSDDIVVELYSNKNKIKEMNDNGEDGDEIAGDHIYSCSTIVKLSNGEYEVFHAKYKNKNTEKLIIRGFKEISEESYGESNATIHELYEAANKYTDETTGFVEPKDVKKAINEVYKAAKERQEMGEVLDINSDENSVLIRTHNGLWYTYQPNVDGIEAFGTNVDLKIITMQPWYSYGPEDDVLNTDVFVEASNEVASKFENVTYSETYMNQGVTRDVINSLGKNQIIVINTHGGHNIINGSYITIGETFKWLDEFAKDCITGRVLLSGDPNDSGSRKCITASYINKYVDDLSHSMVYLGACESLKDQRLASSFREKGADVVIGFTDTVSSGYDRKVYSAIMTALSTYFEEEDEYATIGHAMGYAKKICGENDAAYKETGEAVAEPVYIGKQEYRLFNKYIANLGKEVEDFESKGEEDVENIDAVIKNDFYYEHGFDKIREIKVGEMTNATTYIVNSKNKPIAKASSLYQISKYYRFEGNDTFTKKDGYEWCYYQYTSPTNQNGYGDNEYVSMQITDCLRYFENPIWKNNINSKGFYEFSVTTDDGTFDECLLICKKRKTSTDDIANCWLRIPKGYDGITILHGCMEGWEYKQKYGKYPDYSVDLITEDTSFFRLLNY